MEKITYGSLRLTKPVVEKVVDIYYLTEENGENKLHHVYHLLTYDELDKPIEELLKKIEEENPKLIVFDETHYIDFGDEEIQKHLGTTVYYDEEWIDSQNPDKENFEEWLMEFVDELIFSKH